MRNYPSPCQDLLASCGYLLISKVTTILYFSYLVIPELRSQKVSPEVQDYTNSWSSPRYLSANHTR